MYVDFSMDPGLYIYHGIPDLSYWIEPDPDEEEEVPEWRHRPKPKRRRMVIRIRTS